MIPARDTETTAVAPGGAAAASSNLARVSARRRTRGVGGARLAPQLRGLSCLSAALVLSLASPPAEATVRTRPHVATDYQAAVPLTRGAVWGPGLGIRGGLRVGVPMLSITPELGGEFLRFEGVRKPDLLRGIAGLHLTLGTPFSVGAFGHVGVGRLTAFRPLGALGWNRTALSYDCGGEVEYLVASTVKAGLHGTYGWLAAGDAPTSFEWIAIGIHVALVF